jgi:hypothetical protein
MNRLKLLILFVFFSIIKCTAQDTIFVLHQVVGDTIEKSEKLEFDLFPEIDKTNFKICFIKYSSNKYYLNSFTLTDSLIIRQLDTIEIKKSIEKINKLIDFYTYEAENDSLKKSKKNQLDVNNKNSNLVDWNIVNNGKRSKIVNELKLKNRLKDDAERLKNYKQGTDVFGNGVRFEWHKN